MRGAIVFLAAWAAFGQGSAKKVVILGVPDAALAELRQSAPANVRIVAPAPDRLRAELADSDALVTPQLTRGLLDAGKRLAWVQILNAGVEDALPLVKGTNLTLTNLKVVLGPEVADHAMALLLALTRGLYETIPVRQWEPPAHAAQLTELRGKTAVILGVGGVGTQIAQRAAAFGMDVVGVDPRDGPPPEFVKEMVKPDQLDRVLPRADAVFVTVPDTPATKGMMGAAQFREMKAGSYFIAVSRGTVYSADGLAEAIANRHLAGAGVDVTDPEPLPASHPLWKFPNVLITPHIAGASDGSLGRVVDLLRENLARFAAGKALLNTIDKEKGY